MAAAQHSRPCDEEIRDAIVIGGGPAGLSAALVLGRCLRRVLICDAGHPRNEPARIFNGFLSRDGSTPAEFLQICRDQLRRYETIELRKVKVVDVERGDCRFTAILETGERVAGRMLLLATGLVDLSVLVSGEPLRFVHPVVRTAIYADLSAEEQADLHARAARLLVDHRADQAAAAVHLLATTPSGDPAVVAMLREAARSALAGGAPDTAATLLRRALDEPPDSELRPRVLFELGNAEHEIGDPLAHSHLRAAGETTTDPRHPRRPGDDTHQLAQLA